MKFNTVSNIKEHSCHMLSVSHQCGGSAPLCLIQHFLVATLASSLFTSLWIIHLPAHPSHFLFFHLRINNQHRDRYLVPLVQGLITQAGQKTFFSLYVSTRQLLCRFWSSKHKFHLSKEKVSIILYSHECIIIRLYNRKGWQFCLRLLEVMKCFCSR